MRRAVLRAVLVGTLPLALGCAAQAREARSVPAAEQAPMAPVVAAPAASGGAAPALESVSDARLAVTSSARELAAAAGNCPNACRALGSMDHATGRLCALSTSAADRRACDDATAKVRSSRADVRASCGTCPGGVVVDPDAPCPTP